MAVNATTVKTKYVDTYTSFSGHDMVCTFELPISSERSIARVVGSVQTITYSIHNEKMPVRVLGDMNPKGYVFHNRIIAGTLIFTVFDRHWLRKLMDEYSETTGRSLNMLSDEIPPLNITISMANEYGQKARLALYKVTFVNEGQVMSINDIYTENTYEFFALDLDYMQPVEDRLGNKQPHNIERLRQSLNSNDKNGGDGRLRSNANFIDVTIRASDERDESEEKPTVKQTIDKALSDSKKKNKEENIATQQANLTNTLKTAKQDLNKNKSAYKYVKSRILASNLSAGNTEETP